MSRKVFIFAELLLLTLYSDIPLTIVIGFGFTINLLIPKIILCVNNLNPELHDSGE